MSFIITILAALLVFSAVIAIHEFGHFAVAKLCGIQVNEFSIGMGPVLWKKNRKGTQYSLRALPVGGFVALEGEESPESQQAEAARTAQEQPAPETEAPVQPTGIPLNEAPVWQRVLVMVAGAVMNFVLGFVVLVILIVGVIFIVKGCKKEDTPPADDQQQQQEQTPGTPEDVTPETPVNVDDELLTVVNPWNPLPEDWVSDLVTLSDGRRVDSRCYEAFEEMMDACRDAGILLL